MEYLDGIFVALRSLLRGMKVTLFYFTHPSKIITQQYPENRDSLKLSERFRGEVVLLHDENNEHRCTGCTACEVACPNGTIKILTKKEELPDGKKKKRLESFIYHLQLCTFCNLCIESCPTDAIVMGQDFEFAIYDRSDLTKILEKEGSTLVEELR